MVGYLKPPNLTHQQNRHLYPDPFPSLDFFMLLIIPLCGILRAALISSKELHLTAIVLCFIEAGELGRSLNRTSNTTERAAHTL